MMKTQINSGCCYARETLVRTAEGIEKRVDEIRIGDKLRGFGNKTLTVENIYSGCENLICKITTNDGNHIRATMGHAMKLFDENSREGNITMAANLIVGTMLMSTEGTQEVNSIFIEPYDDTVYNFTFINENEPNYIEANGLWAGDFFAQNHLIQIEEAQGSDES